MSSTASTSSARTSGSTGGGAKKRARTTRTATTSSTSKKPSKYAADLIKAITRVAKCKEDFNKSVTSWDESYESMCNDLDFMITTKESELEYLAEKYNNELRQRKLEVDLAVKEHGRDEALRILDRLNMTAIDKDELQMLRDNYAQLKQNYTADIKAAIAEEAVRNEKATRALTETHTLQKQAEVATVKAQFDAQASQIDMYKTQIARLTDDLNEQRKLTKDVANSAANAAANAPRYFGSGNK